MGENKEDETPEKDEGQESNKSSERFSILETFLQRSKDRSRATDGSDHGDGVQGSNSRRRIPFFFKKGGKKQTFVQGPLLDGSQSEDRSRWMRLIGSFVSRRQVWWGSINASWDLVFLA